MFTLNIIVKPVWLFMDMRFQVEVGDKYGLYLALLNVTLILNILLDLGLSNYNNRKIAVKNNSFSQYFQNISLIRIVLAIAYLLILLLYGFIARNDPKDLWILLMLGVGQVFLSSLLYIRSNFTAFGKFKLDSLFSVLDRLIMIGGVAYLFANRSDDLVNIENFIYVQVIGYGSSFFIGLFTLILIGKPNFPKIETRFTKVLLKKSAPYALIVLLMAAYHSSDAIMLEGMLEDGAAETAIYGQSLRLLTALNNYAYLFAVLLLPMFSKLLAKKEAVQNLIATSSSLLIYGVSSLAILMAYYSEDLIGLCYGVFGDNEDRFIDWELNVAGIINIKDVLISSSVFKVIIFGIIPMSVNYCFGALITASGNMRLLNKIAFGSLVLNIVLNLIVIPQYGAYGAAMASLITQSFSGVFQVFFAIRIFGLHTSFKGVFRFLLGIGVILISTFFIDEIKLSLRIPFLLGLLFAGLLFAVNLKGVLKMAKGFKGNPT